MKVLLIDDDIPTLEVIRDSIDWKAFGINTVQMAFNIADAKKLIEGGTPEIIICDIEMPKGSGIDLLKWIREKGHKSEFIFLTCHESFEFASAAINYNVTAYITKPFNSKKTEAAIAKAVETVAKQNQMQEYSQYGKYWVDSKSVVEQGFWYDIFLNNIPPKRDIIHAEVLKRHIRQDIIHGYYIVLACISRSQTDETLWDDNTFKYAFCNLASEVLLDELDFTHVFSYIQNDTYCNVIVINDDAELNDIQAKCLKLISICRSYLYCTATCYISDETELENMVKARDELEDLDRNNILSRGTVVFKKDFPANDINEQYILDTGLFSKLLTEGEKVQIVNRLKGELEVLAAMKRLDTMTLHSIRQDFMQLVYSVLNKNEIQAHSLFSDKPSQKLFQASEKTVFDMMKWAAFVTDKTIDYLKEVQKSERVVEKAKRYIHQNYSQDINREDVALSVFLTPDYLSKIFKAETGTHIKDYINELRIEKAKELLLQSNLSISEIASESGFESFSYFSTAFKKATGEAPNAFRKTYK